MNAKSRFKNCWSKFGNTCKRYAQLPIEVNNPLTSIGNCAYRLDFFSKSKQLAEKQEKFSIEDIAICISKFLYFQARPSGWSWFRYCVIRRLIWNPAVWEDDHVVKTFCRDDSKRWIFIKYCVDYYYTYFVTLLLKMLLQWQPKPFNHNGSWRFGAVKSDSTHHFFGNACTNSGPLQFSRFSGCWLILLI